MGLTADFTQKGAAESGLLLQKQSPDDCVVALAGNPNVGKSTVFNALTGLHQHTGNWPGKTVVNATGDCTYGATRYILVDIPGTYSLLAHSAEEEVARNFLCFGSPDAVVVVCDATCLERNMNLVLQTIEITSAVVVCVNLMDEARKKNMVLDLAALEQKLGVPVVGAAARSGEGLSALLQRVDEATHRRYTHRSVLVRYGAAVERALGLVETAIAMRIPASLSARWVSLRLLEGDASLALALKAHLGFSLHDDPTVAAALAQAKSLLLESGLTEEALRDLIAASVVRTAETVTAGCVTPQPNCYRQRDRRLDRFLTSRRTGIPVMLLLLSAVLWLTIVGANYPSQLLSHFLFALEERLTTLFFAFGSPAWLHGALVLGVYRVVAWVVAVMLPPMAIFFPLFTLLEDLGYLPRVAFNLDRCFQKCNACGKQSLTMCLGFGCNAAGIVGCRIIDSPRERLIAIITNSFVPCNGRFPTLIAIIGMFFVGEASGVFGSILATALLTGFLLLGVGMTFLVSRILSTTVLKGVPSSFTLELPPFRRPQIGKVIVRSVFDRTLFVLGRAVAVAAPAGLLLWFLANMTWNNASLLCHCAHFFDPAARLFGLDGVIFIAFLLGFPANEIVIPIILMAYLATGSLADFESLTQLKALLLQNGWTSVTALCTMLFSLLHWPCSTTCLTIWKETKSLRWTLLSVFVPTAIGLTVCFLLASTARLFLLV